MRPIDADVMIKDLQAMQSQFDAIAIDGMIRGIEKQPTIEAEPVRHGKWLMITDSKHCGVCSVCFRQDSIDPLATHCRYCGAKMDLK